MSQLATNNLPTNLPSALPMQTPSSNMPMQGMPPKPDLLIKDIQLPLWQIEDYSFYMFLGITFFIFLVFVLIYIFIKYLIRKKRQHIFRVNINTFIYLDTENAKEFAYNSTAILQNILNNISLSAKNIFIKMPDNIKQEMLKLKINSFIELLSEYKYKPNVDNQLNENIKKAYDELVGEFNVYL
jgi:hypothetical protein